MSKKINLLGLALRHSIVEHGEILDLNLPRKLSIPAAVTTRSPTEKLGTPNMNALK